MPNKSIANDSGASFSLWMHTRVPSYKPLSSDTEADVCVIGIAFIGKSPGRNSAVYVITGDSGQGMTHSTLGAMLLADLITGR